MVSDSDSDSEWAESQVSIDTSSDSSMSPSKSSIVPSSSSDSFVVDENKDYNREVDFVLNENPNNKRNSVFTEFDEAGPIEKERIVPQVMKSKKVQQFALAQSDLNPTVLVPLLSRM